MNEKGTGACRNIITEITWDCSIVLCFVSTVIFQVGLLKYVQCNWICTRLKRRDYQFFFRVMIAYGLKIVSVALSSFSPYRRTGQVTWNGGQMYNREVKI